MATKIFVGANSDIAKCTLSMLDSETPVVCLTRDTAKLPNDIQQKYPCYNCDPCDQTSILNIFTELCGKYTIDGVVNFCGNIILKPAAMLSHEEWQSTIDINLNTSFYIAHATTKLIKKDCSLVFFSSAAAHIGIPNHEAIAAAKYGVEGLSKSIAASYAKSNIRSNIIAPGLIQSNLSEHITQSDRSKQLSLSLHALNRLGEPEDIASIVKWLLDEKNNWITGEVIRIDGGLSTIKSYPTR